MSIRYDVEKIKDRLNFLESGLHYRDHFITLSYPSAFSALEMYTILKSSGIDCTRKGTYLIFKIN